jgi:putative lipoic acid-binding regulatory protein
LDSSEPALTFPCLFPLAVIGRNEDGFHLAVIAVIRKHVLDMDEDRFHTRTSQQGSYLSIRVTFWAEDRQQLNNLYRELGSLPQVKMIL